MVARYVHGPGIDEPLAMSRAGSWYYYHFDGLGSVTMLTRADKTIANRYVYDDFGGFRSRTEAVTNAYASTGRHPLARPCQDADDGQTKSESPRREDC